MAKPFRLKRGTTAKNDAFVGLQYEITLDKDKSSLRVHDGVTAGGVAEILPKAKNDELYAQKSGVVTSVNNQKGDVTIDTSGFVSKSGNRGSIGGYNAPNVTSSAVTINADSNEDTQVTQAVAVTVADGASGTTWTKTVSITNANVTVSFNSIVWSWVGGDAPTINANCVLVLYWNNDRGIASLIEGYAGSYADQ